MPPAHGPKPCPSPPANIRWKAPFVVGKSLEAEHPLTYRLPEESSAEPPVRSSPLPTPVRGEDDARSVSGQLGDHPVEAIGASMVGQLEGIGRGRIVVDRRHD